MRQIIILAIASAFTAGCSVESGLDTNLDRAGDVTDIETQTGVFLDSEVGNIGYRTESQEGITNADGEFQYGNEESIVFHIGELEFPEAPAGSIVTPLTLADTPVVNQEALNIARLLQTLDEDGNPENGIRIPDGAEAIAEPVNFDVDKATFENDPAVNELVANSGSANTTLISEELAAGHLNKTLDTLSSELAGAWKMSSGSAFSYLIFFENRTVLYAEYDPKYSEPDNGLEVGTFTYDPSKGTVTASLVFDDNGKATTNSGIGNLKSPSTFSVEISSDGKTLNAADGVLNLSRDDFSSGPAVAGVWRKVTATSFNYLVLFSDGEFLYGEYDPQYSEPDNGLEAGTYSYEANGSTTFNLVYDSNGGTNSDSGIGNTSSPSVVNLSLSTDGQTLTVGGGLLVLQRAL